MKLNFFWYLIIDFINLFNIIYVPVFKIDIIFYQDKLLYHFCHLTFVSQIINPNILGNIMFLHFDLDNSIKYVLSYFGLVFEIIMGSFKRPSSGKYI